MLSSRPRHAAAGIPGLPEQGPPPAAGHRCGRSLAAAVRAVLLGASTLTMAPALVATAQAADAAAGAVVERRFDIPAGPMSRVINRFAAEAGIQLSVDAAMTENLTSPGLAGTYSVRAGLAALLAGTGLVAVDRGGDEYTLSRAPGQGDDERGAAREGERRPGQPMPTLAPVIVTAALGSGEATEGTSSYTPRVTRAATRMALTLRETPQSVTVITAQQLEDRGITGLAQAMETTTGVRVEADWTRPTFYSRGLAISNLYVDGNPMFPGGQGLSNIQSDNMIAYDRIELLRGANGLLTGPGDPSGTVTLVRKRPTQQFQAHVQGSLGSWNNWAGEVDVSGPLNASGTVRGRLAAGTYDGDNFIQNSGRNGKALLATVEVDLAPRTVARLGYQYEQYTRQGASSTSAVPLWYSNGQPYNAARSLNAEAPRQSVMNERARTLYAGLEHAFTSGWAFQGVVALSGRDRTRDPGPFYLSTPTYPNPNGLGANLNNDVPYPVEESQWAYNFDIQGPVNLFGRQHRLMIGASGWDRTTRINERLSDLSGQPSDDFVETYPTRETGDWTQPYPYWYTGFPRSKQYTRQHGVFAAANWNLADSLKLITGLRVTSYKTHTDQYDGQTGALTQANATAYSVRHEVTPYLGAVWDFHPLVSAYASYADIFQPQNLYDANDKLLEPVVGKNYEAGLKGEFLDKRLNASVAIFRTVQDNLGEFDPAYPADYETPGGNRPYRSAGKGITTRGFEVDVSGALRPGWNLHAGYTWARSKDAQGEVFNPNQPEHLLRLFTTYRFQGTLSGLTLGGGANWNSSISGVRARPTGAYQADGSPVTADYEVRQHSVWLLNVMARYRFTPQLSLMVNVDNLLDKTYYNSIAWGPGAIYGTPRRGRVTLRYQF